MAIELCEYCNNKKALSIDGTYKCVYRGCPGKMNCPKCGSDNYRTISNPKDDNRLVCLDCDYKYRLED